VKARNWLAAVVGLLACLGVAYAAYTLADYSWNQVVDYRGPYAKQELPAGETPTTSGAVVKPAGTDAQTQPMVVYVIIDGLRVDISKKMSTLNALRARGTDGVVRTSQPSLSFPNWTTLLSGAPQRISGVTTNWFEGRVPVETLIDTALAASRTVAVSAPTDFEMLYGVKRTGHVFLRDWEEGTYMTGGIVDHAISLAKSVQPNLLVVHFPDVDEAGHSFGGASKEYLDAAMKVDADLGRLVTALQGPNTTFVVTADHGHIDTGGHGGPEDIVTRVPAVFAGRNIRIGTIDGTQDQMAPTVALLASLPAPRNATAMPLAVTADMPNLSRFMAQQVAAYTAYTVAVAGPPTTPNTKLLTAEGARAAFDAATQKRLATERSQRVPMSLGLIALCVLIIAAIAVLSRHALFAALAGTVAYYAVYAASYFLIHGYRWSLSSFNSEALLKGFLNGRMTDAVIAGVAAALVAGLAYVALRAEPKRATGEYLPGWLALGVATVLMVQATIGVQVAWYLWYWGASVSWNIPDLAMGFKYDLDLIQLTGLGAAALLAPVVTLLVGRYHPKVRRVAGPPEGGPAAGVATKTRPLVPAGAGSAASEE
jgi:hypothetical protein